MISISYAITVCNEAEQLAELLDKLLEKIDINDEIVILHDEENTTQEVIEVCRNYQYQFGKGMVQGFSHKLNNDFAAHKNFLNQCCTKDFIFQIDADETPNCALLNSIKGIINENPTVELYYIPRINTVSNITDDHIKKWGWKVNEYGWINFPDHQSRIYKRDNERIFWVNPVHERIIGHEQFALLPGQPEYCLYHRKDIKKQEDQNKFYNQIMKGRITFTR